MRVALICKSCQHRWAIVDEPRRLVRLICPSCNVEALARPSEDFSSALEDTLAQLWLLGQRFDVEVTLGTATLPKAFKPPTAPADPSDGKPA